MNEVMISCFQFKVCDAQSTKIEFFISHFSNGLSLTWMISFTKYLLHRSSFISFQQYFERILVNQQSFSLCKLSNFSLFPSDSHATITEMISCTTFTGHKYKITVNHNVIELKRNLQLRGLHLMQHCMCIHFSFF